MAHKTAPGKFSASFTTPDGNTVKASGSLDPLSSLTAIMLVTTDPTRKPKVLKPMLDLLLAMDVTLPASLVASLLEAFGVLGQRLVDDYKAAGGRVQES